VLGGCGGPNMVRFLSYFEQVVTGVWREIVMFIISGNRWDKKDHNAQQADRSTYRKND